MNFDQRRRWVDGLRAIPLNSVLRAAGAEADRHDPAKWLTPQGVLSVNGAKFFNWNRDRGGGGAIDLAMHLRVCDFTAAVQWLAEHFCLPTAGSPAFSTHSPNLRLPSADGAQLRHVTRYLLEQRGLPAALLRPLVDSGRLYADRRANAVFVLLGKENHPVGAELRGTSAMAWRGLAPGSRKDLGYFACGLARAHELVLCESAIDAISCAAIYFNRLCLSTAGARPNPAWLPPLLVQHHRVRGWSKRSDGPRSPRRLPFWWRRSNTPP